MTDRDSAHKVTVDPIDPKVRKMEVIDTDFHFSPSFDSLRKYMKEPFRSKVLKFPVVGTEYQPNYAVNKEGTGQDVLGSARTGEDLLRVIDEIGVKTVVIDPGFPRLSGVFVPSVLGAIASAYNDYLINEVFPVSDRIRAQIMINQRDPEQAAREVQRVGANPGFVGVYGEYGPYEPMASSRYDVVFDAMAEWKLPLSLHGSGFWQPYSVTANGLRTWTEMIGVAWPSYAMLSSAALVLQGAFDKYPWLNVCIQEGGVWWLIEAMYRLDEFYLDHPGDIQLTERKLELGEQFLNEVPSYYLKKHFYFATQPMSKPARREHLLALFDICNAKERFVYSSDWPHQTFDPANWVVESGIPEDMQQRIFSHNAKELFPRL